jgi:endonuclease YncB( thermonuclease family)
MSAIPRLAFGCPLALVAALLVLKGIDHGDGDGAAEPVAQLSASDRSTEDEIAGRASVVDGDTIEIQGTRIRLHGIDAPEGGQVCQIADEAYRCGQRAALVLSDHLGSRMVRCIQIDVDQWGRSVAKCSVGGQDIGARMVEKGWAVAYRRYSGDYIAHEERARSQQRGLWAGTFDEPERWRRAH